MVHPNDCEHLNTHFEYDDSPCSMGDESDIYQLCDDCGATIFD